MITGATRLLVIVGDPIEHARSPAVINRRLAMARRDAVLVPWHAPAAVFRQVLEGLKLTANLDGIVVTYPFKQRAMALADSIGHAARLTGALNALRREVDGSWTGDMFDGVGLVGALHELGRTPGGARVKLLGAGGAGRAIAFALAKSGAASIDVYDVNSRSAEALTADLLRGFPGCSAVAGGPELREADLLVNASPIGLQARDELPISLDDLTPATDVVDIVPRDDGTALLARARQRGCRCVDGAAMVEGQAGALLRFFRLGDNGSEDPEL